MAKISPNASCPCHSGKKYKKCCRPYHAGRTAPTPESVMRARFSAYALDDADFIMRTTHRDCEQFMEDEKRWRAQLDAYMLTHIFLGLEVTHAEDDRVHFNATIYDMRNYSSVTEHSIFKQHEGEWLYLGYDKESAEKELAERQAELEAETAANEAKSVDEADSVAISATESAPEAEQSTD